MSSAPPPATEPADAASLALLAQAAHDLRTPLQVLLSWSALLQRGDLPPQKVVLASTRILQAVRQQSRMLDELQELAHALAGAPALEPAAADLGTLLRQALQAFYALGAGATPVVLADADALPPAGCHVDARRLERSLVALLEHAAGAVRPGDGVDVALRVDGADGVIEIGWAPADAGAAHDAATLFAPLRRRGIAGGGPALALAQRIVAAHGGELGATLQPDFRRAAFLLRLPLAAPAP